MQLKDQTYYIQDIPVLDIVKEYGAPIFVYDGAKIEKQYHRLVSAFKVKDLKINYACKALTNVSILRLFKSLGSGIDAVSIGEITLALKAGFAPQDILFTPSSVSISEYLQAKELGVRINIDNLETLEYFGHHFPEFPVGIRINPHIMAGGNQKISVGHIDSKFGISVHQLPMIKRLVNTLEINLEGVHLHTGSDIYDSNSFLAAAEILFNVAKEFDQLKYIDFGSGFKVKYKTDDIETNIEEIGKEMTTRFKRFCKEYGRELQLIFEPGKFLVSEAGLFLAETNVVKQTISAQFVCLNTGFNHLIRPMFYSAHHDILNLSNPGGTPRIYSVVGYICETDTFASNRKIAEVRVGDVIAFKNAGAYAFMMASNYNTRLLPPEVLIHNGKAYLIRKRQTFDELFETMPDPVLEGMAVNS